MKKIALGVVFLAAVVLLVGCASGSLFGGSAPTPTVLPPVKNSGVVSAEGRIMPKQYAYLSFPTAGQVDKVLVQLGDKVEKDSLLASLGMREQAQANLDAAKLAQVQAQQAFDDLNKKADLARSLAAQALTDAKKVVVDAQKAYDDLNTDDFQKQINDKDGDASKAKDTLKDAQDKYDKYKDLAFDNQTRKDAKKILEDALKAYNKAVQDRDVLINQREQLKDKLDLAQAQLNDAQRAVDNKKDGADKEDLALSQARLDQANSQAAAAQKALDNLDLKAPFGGNIVDLVNNLSSGQWIQPAQTVITLVDVSTWYIETKDLTELDVVKVSPGQKVVVTLDALTGQDLTGVVESVKDVYTEKSGDVLYTVRIKLDATDAHLKWGMTATVKFQ